MRNAEASREVVSGDATVVFLPLLYLYGASELTTELTGYTRQVTANYSFC